MTTPGTAAPEERPRKSEPEKSESAVPEQRTAEKSGEYATTESEKLAARYEARHDVAARGRAPDPMHVQHYLAHRRSEEALRKAEHEKKPEHDELEELEEPGEAEQEYQRHAQWRGWFRYGEDG